MAEQLFGKWPLTVCAMFYYPVVVFIFLFKSGHPKSQVCFRVYNQYNIPHPRISLMGLMFIWVAYIFYRGTYCHSSIVGFASLDRPAVYRHANSYFRQKHDGRKKRNRWSFIIYTKQSAFESAHIQKILINFCRKLVFLLTVIKADTNKYKWSLFWETYVPSLEDLVSF